MMTMTTRYTEREKALLRDNFRCRVCGTDFGVQAHHVVYRSLQGEDSVDNYVCLCYKCHDEVHNKRLVIQIQKYSDGTIEVFVKRRKT